MYRMFSMARQKWRGIPNWAVGVALATPAGGAIVQGSILLTEYRRYHGTAPYPLVPSRGMVVVEASSSESSSSESSSSESSVGTSHKNHRVGGNGNGNGNGGGVGAVTRTRTTTNASLALSSLKQRPLQILVIGDSLAAGVGTSKSATPILPESIAKSLSHALGRPVGWTCIGNPGADASMIVQDILQMDRRGNGNDDDDDNEEEPLLLEKKLVEWQTTTRRALDWLRNRIERDVREVKWQQQQQQQQQELRRRRRRKEEEEDDDDDEKKEAKRIAFPWNPVRRWWTLVKRDVRDFKEKVVERHADEKETRQIILHKKRLTRRRSIVPEDIDPAEFEIAIVFTGLNDLKHAFLPFMIPDDPKAKPTTTTTTATATTTASTTTMSERKTTTTTTTTTTDNSTNAELLRVLQALQGKMNMKLPGLDRDDEAVAETTLSEEEQRADQGGSTNHISTSPHQRHHHGPLVVFPAIPSAPQSILHRAPLKWFLIPLIHRLDLNKKKLADRFPHLVLYVEPPSNKAMRDLEQGQGPLFAAREAERVLLTITDATNRAKERVERLMKEHYHRLTSDREEEEEIQKQLQDNLSLNNSKDRDCPPKSRHHHDVIMAENDPTRRPPGSTLISLDGIHPNDEGYDFWGRHIAEAIIGEWHKGRIPGIDG